ncbi:hypothetical protein [Neomoorella thermoacetica]|uniref:hypothetical protein n=1 Tax=Neomoorella thermoacetica TaxID=1525 RepID=UPI0008FB5EB0|nr:hypothetical protein [Moorella thermoacetica]APC08613.1 hypothetical protein MTJW_14540 [Moorella thermoacetica]
MTYQRRNRNIVGNLQAPYKQAYKQALMAIHHIIFTIIHLPFSAIGVIANLFGITGIFFWVALHFISIHFFYPLIFIFFKNNYFLQPPLHFCLIAPWLFIFGYLILTEIINFLIRMASGTKYFRLYLSSPLCYYFALKLLNAGNVNLHLPLNSLYLEVHLPLACKYKRNPYLKDALVEDAKLFLRFLSKIKLIKGAIIYGYTPLAVGGLLKLAGADVKYISIPTLIDPERALSVRATKKQFNFYTIIYKRKESPNQKNITPSPA